MQSCGVEWGRISLHWFVNWPFYFDAENRLSCFGWKAPPEEVPQHHDDPIFTSSCAPICLSTRLVFRPPDLLGRSPARVAASTAMCACTFRFCSLGKTLESTDKELQRDPCRPSLRMPLSFLFGHIYFGFNKHWLFNQTAPVSNQYS